MKNRADETTRLSTQDRGKRLTHGLSGTQSEVSSAKRLWALACLRGGKQLLDGIPLRRIRLAGGRHPEQAQRELDLAFRPAREIAFHNTVRFRNPVASHTLFYRRPEAVPC